MRALVFIVGGIAFLMAAFAAVVSYGREEYRKGVLAGYDSAIAEVRKQDSVAADAAGKKRGSVRECYDNNGEWDAAAGVCHRP